MDSGSPRTVYRLVVTGPARDRLYRRFAQLFYGREDVVVVMDRRETERRAAARPADAERRRADRRTTRPDWTVPPA